MKDLKIFDWFLIAGVTFCSLGYSVLEALSGGGMSQFDWIGTIAAVSGLFCVVLSAHGNILNYAFGIVNVSLYAWISYKSNLLGDCLLNALYYVPMQFIGFAVWRRRASGTTPGVVLVRSMDWKGRALSLFVSACIVLATGFALSLLRTHAVEGSVIARWHLYSEYPYKDALTTVCAIVGQFLMARAFMEQWFYWIVMDIVSMLIWAMFAIDGVPHAVLMFIMYVFYTANAVNGARVWAKLPRA